MFSLHGNKKLCDYVSFLTFKMFQYWIIVMWMTVVTCKYSSNTSSLQKNCRHFKYSKYKMEIKKQWGKHWTEKKEWEVTGNSHWKRDVSGVLALVNPTSAERLSSKQMSVFLSVRRTKGQRPNCLLQLTCGRNLLEKPIFLSTVGSADRNQGNLYFLWIYLFPLTALEAGESEIRKLT